ncbi:EF-hand calcium-binding domain-containing protein 6 [Balearica regulorum gibbericeps]|uniref:EF-hand calcium-binding domain-containing protein 6 n=1 Tax=Balearica regulorum gibbericeps TaxID=100784 RepID=UPI003F6130FE
MARVTTSEDLSALHPSSQGITFTPGPDSTQNKASLCGSRRRSIKLAAAMPVSSVPDPTLFSWGIGQILLQKTPEKEDELKKAFQMLDVGQTLTVTKSEFRRAIETFLFHLTEAEFDAVLAEIPNIGKVTVPYLDFLSKFTEVARSTSMLKKLNSHSRHTMTLSQLESLLKEKIAKNVKNIIRCCRLFDYSRAGWIQRHTLRQILEITCFRMKDSEFEKLWNRYCVRESNMMDYKEFLKNFGISTDTVKEKITENEAPALICQKIKEKEQKPKKLLLQSSPAKLFLQPSPAEHAVTECSLDSTKRAFREKLHSAYQDIEKAFRAIDVSQSGVVSLDYLKSVINGFIFPLPNETFQELMNRVNPARGDKAFSSDTVLQKLRRYIQDAYPSLKQAFLTLDEGSSPNLALRSLSPLFLLLRAVSVAYRRLSANAGAPGKADFLIDISSSWRRDGKITRNYLCHVLRNLVLQLKDKDFQELIEILDLEQTGYLDYHEFLDLFEEKESVVEEILSHKITENWKDFHKALQSYDPKSTGTINRSYLRKVIQLCCPSLSDQQFMKLCYKYKDNSSDGIFYKMLLDNLKVAVLSGDLNGIGSHISKEKQQREEKRQTELSKRIKQIEDQANKYAQNRTVDEVIKRLKDRVIQQAATIKDSFFAYNKQSHRKINKAGLRKVLEDHGMPMDDSEFNLLTEKLGLPDGGLSYLDFVAILEDARLNGPGATLRNGPNHRVNDAKYHYVTAEECLNQLNDKLKEVYGDTYSAFRETDSNHDGITNMLNFRQFLDSFLLRLRDEEFQRLLGLLGMNLTSTLNYREFCQLFHTQETKEVLPRLHAELGTWFGNQMSFWIEEQPEYYLSGPVSVSSENNIAVSVCDCSLKPCAPDLYAAGALRADKIRLMESSSRNGENSEGSQAPKVDQCGIQGCRGPEPRELRISCYFIFLSFLRRKQITDAELACDHAHYYLVIKARTRWHDLARNFQEFDSEGNGIMQPRDLKKVLFRFGIPITPEEFKQLWARYDTDAKGYLTHQEFLQKLGIEFAPADTGLSRHIMGDSSAHLQAHYNNQQKKHSKLEEQQKQQSKALHVREIKKQIKDKFRDYFQDFSKLFHKVDKNRDGYVTVCDLHRILQEFNYYLDHDQFSSLLNSLGISIHDSKLSYFDFLRAIDDGRASKYQQRQKQAAPPASFAALSLEQTLIKIKEIVASSYDLLYKAFSLFDKDDTGVIKALEFQQVLDHFCFKLSDKQFRHLLKNLNLCEDFTVDWKVFLKNIDDLIETEEGQKVIPPKSSWELSERSILSQIQEGVTAGFNTIAQEFKDIDSSKDNTISKEEFWDICNQHFQRLTEEQSDNLWNTMDVSASGRLKYQDVLKRFSPKLVMMPPSAPSVTGSATSTKPATCAVQKPRVCSHLERPKTSSSLQVQKSIPASRHPWTTATCSAPVLNCETIENKIRKNIQHTWRGILKACKEKDVGKLGEIPVSDFLDIAEKFNLDLSEGEINQITTKYDLKKNRRFAYYDFLQNCILLLKPQESSLLQRVIIQKPQNLMSPGPQTPLFFSTMLRIQPRILHCWRPMKQTFKSYDESHTGLLDIADFRQVLHEYSINLTEEELFNVLEYYDKTLSSKISYNDFLWAFIQ